MKYYVVYEKSADGGWGAYPPDLPGVGVVADTKEEARESVRKAIEMHLKGMRAQGEPISEPSGEFVEVA